MIAPVNFSEVTVLMIELADFIAENNGEAYERWSVLKPFLRGLGVHEVLEQLEEQLDRCDFEGALVTLSTLARVLNISMEKKGMICNV